MMLEEFQRAFWRAMRMPQVPDEIVTPYLGGRLEPATLERVLIYRRAYWARQIEALRDEFRRLATRLGERDFAALMQEYLTAHPSEDPRIEWVGRHLPRFLGAHPEAARRHLADLAAFEWAEVETLLAADPACLTTGFDVPAQLFPCCTLAFVPALHILRLASDPLAGDEGRGRPTRLAVWRKSFAVRHRVLDPDEHAAATAARAGAEIARVFDAFASVPDPAARASAVFGGWLADGWVSRIVVPPSEHVR
jgi:hypothetical protein